MHQHATLEDTVYFGFGANLLSGAAGDGATPLFDVRLGGGAAGDAPILSGTPTLLTHANYTDGCYEVAVAATAVNGFAAGNTYLVFVSLTIDSVTPAACIGTFKLAPVPANVTQLLGTAYTAPATAGTPDVNVTKWRNTAVSDPTVEGVPDVNVKTINDVSTSPVTTVKAVQGLTTADTITTTTNLTNLPATAALEATLTTIAGYLDTEIAAILADTNELQTDWVNGGRLDLILDIIAADTTTDIPALIAALPTAAENFTAVLTTALTEAYAADGVAPTLAQAIFLIMQSLHEFAISGTTRTVKKLDGTTTAATFTLDDATNPTSTTRAS